MLASITKKKREDWLINFIRNSQQVIADGDPYANYMFEQYDRQVMPSFEVLSYEEIKSILLFIEQRSSFDGTNSSLSAIGQDDHIDPGVLRGKVIFRDQCQSCHLIDRESFGPALGSVTKRHPDEWLEEFIRNSTAVIESGDDYAIYLYERFDQKVMVPMPFLTDDDISDVLDYIALASGGQQADADGKPVSRQAFVNNKPAEKQNEVIAKYVLMFICAMSLLVIVYLLVRLFRYLDYDLH
jgi:cytochrome c2